MSTLDSVCRISDDVVVRSIEGELIIVPLTSGVGNLDDELYSLNETGRAIVNLLDGARTLREIASALAREYDAPRDVIENDVVGLATELLGRGMLVELTPPVP